MTSQNRIVSSEADAASSETDAPRHVRMPGSFSIRVYLLALILVVLLPALIFSGALLIRMSATQNRAFERAYIAATHSIAELVDRDVSSMLATLSVTSTSTALDDGDMRLFQKRARSTLADRDANLMVLDGRFDQLMNTRFDYGTKLPKAAHTDAARKALKSNWPVVSNLFYDADAGRWAFNVAMPVEAAKGPARVLVLTRYASTFATTLSTQQVPKGWKSALVDGTRTVIASSGGSDATGRPFYIPFDKGLSSGFTHVMYRDTDYQIVVQPSDITGWSIVSWAPTASVRAPLNRSLAWLVFGGIFIAFLAVTAAFFIARIMSGSVRHLTRQAERLGAGETVEARDQSITEFTLVSQALAQAAHERKNAEGEIRFLMREVAHRSKNQLTVIQAMLNQTAKLSDTKEEFAEAFRKRVAGLARSTDLMISNATQGVDLATLVADQIETFRPSEPERVVIAGPEIRLDAQSAQVLGMAIHELATNAAKYGAFAGAEGLVEVTWTLEDETVRFDWRERQVPISAVPERKGFGSVVLERILGISLGAELERTMHDDGIEWVFLVSVDKLRDGIDRRI
ncbi:sensor histidine kinase [Pararhizobium mangrovi]|uniref:histidine kinase n=1 Tax=Pararhizobium mangrovi TaxID=2590452 RepID=A0A506TY37_9HYPH|nr:sensor histidine kinase [Pararhizobium mangrovi]TPW26108.1 HAMP domain-containing protein [Pararhizobium mangrovi]